jgi:hypothetical protein
VSDQIFWTRTPATGNRGKVMKKGKLIVLATDGVDGAAEVRIRDDCDARITVSPARMRDMMEQCADDERALDFILEAMLNVAELKAKGEKNLAKLERTQSRLHLYRIMVCIVDSEHDRGVSVRTDGEYMHVQIGSVFFNEIEKFAEADGKPLFEALERLVIEYYRAEREHRQLRNN